MTRMLRGNLVWALTILTGLLALTCACAAQSPPLRKLTVGSATSWFTPDVSPEDVKWRAPAPDGMKNAPIFGYAHRWKPGQPIPNMERVQMPLYRNFDSDDPKWWDEQLDEVLFTRPAFIFLIGRGCTRPEDSGSTAGPGNMCPYKLRMMVDAVRRAAAEDAARFAMFLDTGATFALRRMLTRKGDEPIDKYLNGQRDPATLFDLSDRPDVSGRSSLWYFWDATIKPWFDTVPPAMWYRFDDRGKPKPVIAFWDLASRFAGKRGDTAKLLRGIRDKFIERYSVEPFFLVQTSWIADEPGLAELVGGVHDWFRPRFGEPSSSRGAISRWTGQRWERDGTPDGLSSLTEWAGGFWGVTVPGFGCGPGCRIPPVPRLAGRNFEAVLKQNRSASINLVEGFNGPFEDTAAYRSSAIDAADPNRYMKLLRSFSDPSTVSTKLQAEGADRISAAPADPANQPFAVSYEIHPLAAEGGAWSLEAAQAGDGFLYKQIYFDGGDYRFILRATAETTGLNARIIVDGREMASRPVPRSPDGEPVVIEIGSATLAKGLHDTGVVVDGKAGLDWLVVNRGRLNRSD